ncbi:unnamed protein product [Caenorhabditis auriculariae]|uniref:Uncharacterized protein n=1 Tax=Caenorhabditis auriculariae TaxID=2777116 RepID=A0A8S1HUF1_9PELO|nr:unnamed protein product [Caenorhabditis auriculariae]
MLESRRKRRGPAPASKLAAQPGAGIEIISSRNSGLFGRRQAEKPFFGLLLLHFDAFQHDMMEVAGETPTPADTLTTNSDELSAEQVSILDNLMNNLTQPSPNEFEKPLVDKWGTEVVMSQKGSRLFYDDLSYEYRYYNANRDAALIGFKEISLRCTKVRCRGSAVLTRNEEVHQKKEHDPPHGPPIGRRESMTGTKYVEDAREKKRKAPPPLEDNVPDDGSSPSLSIISQRGGYLFYDEQDYEYRLRNPRRDCLRFGERELSLRCAKPGCRANAKLTRKQTVIPSLDADPHNHAPLIGKLVRRQAITKLKMDRLAGVTPELPLGLPMTASLLPNKSTLGRTSHPPAKEPRLEIPSPNGCPLTNSLLKTFGFVGTADEDGDEEDDEEEEEEEDVEDDVLTKSLLNTFNEEKKSPVTSPAPSEKEDVVNGTHRPSRLVPSDDGKDTVRMVPEDTVQKANVLADLVREQAIRLLTSPGDPTKFDKLWSDIIKCVYNSDN